MDTAVSRPGNSPDWPQTMPSGDEIRDGQRAAWAGLSAGWEKWDSVIMDQLAPVGKAIIERLGSAEDLPFGDATFDSVSVRIPGVARCIVGTK